MGHMGGQGSLHLVTGDLSFKRKSANQNTSPQLSPWEYLQSQEPEIAHDEPSFYGWITSHIALKCALNPNAPTFVGQSVDNYVLHSSFGLQTLKDLITNTVSELNISNEYFTADIEELESDTPYSLSFFTSKTKWD